jgi:hypothetical protein
MNHPRSNTAAKVALILAACACILASLYCFMGVLQTASLFTGERALVNSNLWSSLSLAFGVSAVHLIRATSPAVKTAHPLVSIAWALLWVSIFSLATWQIAVHLLDVDRCQDGGGSFDYVAGKCDLVRKHSTLAIWKTHGFLLVVATLAFIHGLLALDRRRRTG